MDRGQSIDHHEPMTDKAKEILERVLANEELMRQVRAGFEQIEQGRPGTPWKEIRKTRQEG